MNEGFSTAFMLLSVGMITVFTILALIVLVGNALINVINSYFPEEQVASLVTQATPGSIDSAKLAAIISAVEVATGGKAKVTSITKTE
jgi:oxaloacetate decarboxylase gamma subunit